MAEVILKNVTKVFPGGVTAVKSATIEVKDKEFLVLVGPSGCGKSTTLRMVAGLEEITEGEIYIDGVLVNDIPPKDRDIAMVFQNYALYPHMTVYKNMAFGLKLRRFPKKEIDERVREAAAILGIEDLLDRKPKALSGGQRQRVAVGRAIVRKPKVFLFDEPLSNLDAKLRVQMRAELQKLHSRLQSTVIYVTHDQIEAMTMGDRIVVMRDGNILQVDDPLTLYEHPANKFVAGFIGSPPMNFVDGRIVRREGKLYFSEGTDGDSSAFTVKLPERVAEKAAPYDGQVVTLGIRPDDIYDRATEKNPDPETVVRTMVDVAEPMGSEVFLYLSAGAATLVARVDVHTHAQVGEPIEVVFDMDKAHLFDKETEDAIT